MEAVNSKISIPGRNIRRLQNDQQSDWKKKKPSWIAGTNEDWGSHRVRYWQPQWKHILFGSPDAYLDTILAAGFDGAFLDVVDVYQYFRDKKN